MSAVCHFQSLEDAVKTAQQIIQYGVPIARIEMLNKDQMEISIKYSKLDNIKASPTLFFEFHGSEESNKEAIKIVEELSLRPKLREVFLVDFHKVFLLWFFPGECLLLH